jgi:hypothetical protein
MSLVFMIIYTNDRMFLSTVKNRRIMENSSLILLEEYTLSIWLESQRIFLVLDNTHIIHTPVIPNKKTGVASSGSPYLSRTISVVS